MVKIIKQPIATQKELNKINTYHSKVKKSGYLTWVTVRQSHSIGQGQIVINSKLDRALHFLSRGELQPYFHFEHNSNVVNIFEQFPLPLDATLKIAVKLNILHPGSYLEAIKYDGQTPAKTMSTDYLVKLKNGKYIAYTFKYSDSLDPKETSPISVARTNKKFEIERAYWASQGIEFIIITEKTFHVVVTNNLRYLREHLEYSELVNIGKKQIKFVFEKMQRLFDAEPLLTVREVLVQVSLILNIELFQCQCLFQYFVYSGLLKVDLLQLVNLNQPLHMKTEEFKIAG